MCALTSVVLVRPESAETSPSHVNRPPIFLIREAFLAEMMRSQFPVYVFADCLPLSVHQSFGQADSSLCGAQHAHAWAPTPDAHVVHACTSISARAHACDHMVYTCVCVDMCTHVLMHVFVDTRVYVCMNASVYTHYI